MLPPFARLLAVVFDASRRTAPHIWLGAAVALTVAAAPAPAHAQLLKRIKQAATEKAAEAAGRKVLGGDSASAPAAADAPAARGTSSAAASASARSSGPAKLEITGERVALFLTAMEPALDAARERDAYLAAKAKRQQYDKCVGDVQVKNAQAMARGEDVPTPTKAQQAEMDRIADRGTVIVNEMMAAQQKNDTAKIRVLVEESERNLFRMTLLATPAIGRTCGTTPPPKAVEPDEARMKEKSRPRKVDGMSATQFGRMRERIAMYLVAPEKGNDLTPEEKSAIDARRADFAPFVKAWKDGSLEWSYWGDVFSAWK
ncbi:hypothetical protein [Roseisolibacter agri]|uniref:Uncharacterized protein n=1 Tax=Roseisolibacter agri TaxID=2014610 RepID=A0AA37V121_9BACT|nr:hypothetical protein [Roseisolibacter agri]GLC25495.1 hypothetical protein rosag_20080 [Roseisolibacter agri]